MKPEADVIRVFEKCQEDDVNAALLDLPFAQQPCRLHLGVIPTRNDEAGILLHPDSTEARRAASEVPHGLPGQHRPPVVSQPIPEAWGLPVAI